MTILVSGRFDRPHMGHIVTLGRLGREYEKVIIVILDYPGQTYPISYRITILDDILSMMYGNYHIVSNKTHFGEISESEIRGHDFDVYGTGNLKVLKHMDEIGINSIYLERAYDYSATDDRNIQAIKGLINER